MSEPSLRMLVVENEFIIAIDAADMLTRRFGGEVSVRSKAELANTGEPASWDAVLMDTAGSDADAFLAATVLKKSRALVFLTGYAHLVRGVPGFTNWPVVMKPFTEEVLAEAVIAALMLSGAD